MNNMCNSNSNSNFNNNNNTNSTNQQHIPPHNNNNIHNNIKRIKVKATDKLNFQLPIPDKSNKMDIE
jgi:hypothetical protein